MRLIVLDENYPHINNLMGDVFVHVRIKEYIKKNIEIRVISFFHTPQEINYEGIDIKLVNSIEQIIKEIKEFDPDKILIHFYQSWMLEKIIKTFNLPFLIWVHGHEALGWYRRLFNFKWYSPLILNYIKKNTLQQFQLRKLIEYSNQTGRVEFIFVSNWMKKITEQDTISKIKSSYIIANPIDVTLFSYKEKNKELRKKILILRSFNSRKYANDISVSAIKLLAKNKIFDDLEFTIIGEGPFYEKVLEPIKGFKNIRFQNKSIKQVLIPDIHSQNGIFLCPTRQDAQGVSMCEAMSSGLIPITSNNTAIPEFVINNISGFLTNSPKEIAEGIEKLYLNPDLFSELSKNASNSIYQKCNIDFITDQELKIIVK